MRKFRTPEIEHDTGCTTFDRGTRKLIVRLSTKGVHIRAARQSAWRFLPWGAIYDRATMAVADFDAGPAKTKTITRGRVS